MIASPRCCRAATRRSWMVILAIASALPAEAVDPTASVDLLGGHIEPELLLERPGDGAAHSMRLPAECGSDFGDGCSVGALQHGDQLGLLAAFAGIWLRWRLDGSMIALRRFRSVTRGLRLDADGGEPVLGDRRSDAVADAGRAADAFAHARVGPDLLAH